MFSISRPNGLVERSFNSEDESLAEALNTAYGNDFRKWDLSFCGIKIPLTMACIADIYADMVGIIKKIDIGEKFTASFLSIEIACAFEIEPSGKVLFISSDWTSASNNVHLAELRSLPGINKFGRSEFTSQIISFLQAAKDDLISLGYAYLFDDDHPWGVKLY